MNRNGMVCTRPLTLGGCVREKFGTYRQLCLTVGLYHLKKQLEDASQHYQPNTPESQDFLSRLLVSTSEKRAEMERQDIGAAFSGLEYLKTLPDKVDQAVDKESVWNKMDEECGKGELQRGLELMDELIRGVQG